MPSKLRDHMVGRGVRSCAHGGGIVAVLAVIAALAGSASATREQALSFAAAADIGMTADASATLSAVGPPNQISSSPSAT
jgi:hypothetical protein